MTLAQVVRKRGFSALLLCFHSFSFGACFNQSVEKVALPGIWQSLTFRYEVNGSLQNVALPGSLQSLSLGTRYTRASRMWLCLVAYVLFLSFAFNQSLENAAFAKLSFGPPEHLP